ncbi:MAG: pyridine nucleotide-disulfide oxidoreductase [Burkholderiales bacterium 35-55-47]|uniref:dihydrolipoyl dehydrogenase family protein n=1 Tax=Limnohabitans sp. TaxID=1907725 RepID=UPI000BD0BD11|nr:NAD(P)/FAD-dependent oxidoreductase [Limnohabitans sp.]OYY20052.1 MAG: pyridine nucleotide-disulfide oxidoreductase [Burkholderiales bacterium 35-55-47]OYZ74338.1 MAG: pyridine nucleotide-disulfide oxidoreductase [Burkholderiales bacterium 24-55-52]OZB01771.1 MAG: pyridine nucleotide-disulfide oxidoreductase [Burkholderiales bacterium 39-55-53]HQR86279.1 NAD(P)/FAD-dependent oxidoreductase [Limnohabitans sp.]HQS25804.1 NAD(P)/FAD-dependent oxidoreductase [Limnohabitans sp.]
MEKFDLCVIGAGPSGFAAAMRALDFGKRVALVERNKVGGAGIFDGALSSKTLWELSESYQLTRNTNLGYTVYDSEVHFSSVMHQAHRAVAEKHVQLKKQISYFEKTGRLTFFKGHAKFASKNEIGITDSEGQSQTIWADNTVMAVGSRPRYLPHIPIDEKIILTSDGVSSLPDFPKSIVILGAGVIGCEFATIFSNFGKTKVFLIDKEERILPFEDEDISHAVAANLEDNGAVIHHGASLEKMSIVDGKVEYVLSFKDGRKETHTVEKALISVGRVSNCENLGLEAAGVALNERGCIDDEHTRSNVPNIYAVGDFTADISLVNVGELEGRHAVERMFGSPKRELVYENISTIMFLNPEVASVGLNETQARKKKIPYRIAIMHYRYVNRALAMHKLDGFFKILVSDDDDMKILGMRVMGPHASSTIMAVALMISMDIGIEHLAELIFPHPSIPEGIQECARMLMGTSIVKPEVFNLDVRCYRVDAEGRVEDL